MPGGAAARGSDLWGMSHVAVGNKFVPAAGATRVRQSCGRDRGWEQGQARSPFNVADPSSAQTLLAPGQESQQLC